MADHDAALSSAGYWDKYYLPGGEGEAPTPAWFRSFEEIQEFVRRNLIQAQGRTPADNPWIVHIGSGNSVRFYNLSCCCLVGSSTRTTRGVDGIALHGYQRQT